MKALKGDSLNLKPLTVSRCQSRDTVLWPSEVPGDANMSLDSHLIAWDHCQCAQFCGRAAATCSRSYAEVLAGSLVGCERLTQNYSAISWGGTFHSDCNLEVFRSAV